jgi:hypothetical protein
MAGEDKPSGKEADVPIVFEVTEPVLTEVLRRVISVSADGEDRLIMSMTTKEFAAYFIDLQKAKMYLQAEMENDTMTRVLADVKGIGSVAAATLPFRVSSVEEVDRLATDLKGVLKGPNRPEAVAIIVAQVRGKEYGLCPK